jgi:FkbM family methyltransferase
MFVNANDFIGQTLETYGEWAYSEIDLLAGLIKPGHVVLDIGANIGTHTLSFAKMVQPDGFVFSFEPQRISFEFMCANVVANNLTNVFPVHAGVSDKADKIYVPIVDPTKAANAAAFAIQGYSAGDPVDIVTVDSMRLGRCNLIKADVEGMEYSVLQGARQTIETHRPVLFVENNYEEHSEKIITLVKEWRYTPWWFFSTYSDPKYAPDFNLLCLPEGMDFPATGLIPVLDEKDTGPAAYTRATGILLEKQS